MIRHVTQTELAMVSHGHTVDEWTSDFCSECATKKVNHPDAYLHDRQHRYDPKDSSVAINAIANTTLTMEMINVTESGVGAYVGASVG